MSDLHLDSLEIKNFRCFEHLVIEKLGRVNLIVGRNSVGKTALLEALWILTTKADVRIIQKILYDRNELASYKAPGSIPSVYVTQIEAKEQSEAFRKLFFGRPKKIEKPAFLRLNEEQMKLSLDEFGGESFQNYLNLRPIVYVTGDQAGTFFNNWLPYPQKDQIESLTISASLENKSILIPTSGLPWQALSSYWDAVALTDSEDNIIEALRIIDQKIKRLTFKGEHQPDKTRFPIARVEDQDETLPLASLGEGATKSLGLALAMVNCDDGFLLVDEFETGLHYSAQTEIWRMVFRIANQRNIRVFATTHSWDCVEAFQEAAEEDQNEEAMLIRLQRKRDSSGIEAINYDERRLEIATRQGVEVR
ncbi:ATPase/GTPase, AAA15 family [Methylomagnum ishizawai]|uniref:ATPase/GTPase, AAA15 family n=1 Tax=Methylomagnum ishizawai TaxID=1760988 RepID=A0A1Y6D813_9GAMM|nr:AAA family ATPase [Methylomagnum ishizawai]SMF96913.1 ATPase/GTPase, AAA15 family [Methylomagnum ishizawai]